MMLRLRFLQPAVSIALTICCGGVPAHVSAQTTQTKNFAADDQPINFRRAKGYLDRKERGEKLTTDEDAYLQRALEERRKQQQRPGNSPSGNMTPREKTGLKPLSDMAAEDRYQSEDGGLYGNGQNAPPAEHRRAAEKELARIMPLNNQGFPAPDGQVVFISISMSNATQEFSRFKRIADVDKSKSPNVTIVDCAQGGQAMAEWAPPDAPPWSIADLRLENARVSPQQVQMAWIKLANKSPQGTLEEHGRKLQRDTTAVIQNAKSRFPNLRIAYLSSRIYGGYATNPLNPEPYAYESAFAVRWLIQEQMRGAATLNFNPNRGIVNAPLLLWGPYLWADGTQPRSGDKLTWLRTHFANDGTHPSDSGRDQVANQLLQFGKSDSLAKSWFVK